MREQQSQMFCEAASVPDVIRTQLASNASLIDDLAAHLRGYGPTMLVTCGRGSSDHAATFAKYLFESRLGLVTSSAAPSIVSLYDSKLKIDGALYIAISQSGMSPDIVRHAEAAREGGACVVTLTNDVQSPLAKVSEWVIPLHAAPEKSVAATRSYIASLTVLLNLLAVWGRDAELLEALHALPTTLQSAWQQDWTLLLDDLSLARNLFVVSRGVDLSIAQEAALKFKETCGLHAEAYSAAEVLHGPIALAEPKFPVLIFGGSGRIQASIDATVSKLEQWGAQVYVAGGSGQYNNSLPTARCDHELLSAPSNILTFYRLANRLSFARGIDPDSPRQLMKVTETV